MAVSGRRSTRTSRKETFPGDTVVLVDDDGRNDEHDTPDNAQATQPETPTSKSDDVGSDPTVSIPAKSPVAASPSAVASDDSYVVQIPHSIGMPSAKECTVLVQVPEQDAAKLDFEGASGAIGRWEAPSFAEDSVTLDLKGCQYSGQIQSGPTVMVVGFLPNVGFAASANEQSSERYLKIEAITDEFIPIVQGQDIMKQLSGTILQGSNTNWQDGSDESDAPVPVRAKPATLAKSDTSGEPADKTSTSSARSGPETPAKTKTKKIRQPSVEPDSDSDQELNPPSDDDNDNDNDSKREVVVTPTKRRSTPRRSASTKANNTIAKGRRKGEESDYDQDGSSESVVHSDSDEDVDDDEDFEETPSKRQGRKSATSKLRTATKSPAKRKATTARTPAKRRKK